MKSFVLIATLALLLTTACAEQANLDTYCVEVRDALSNLILKFLYNLRSHMSTGLPSLDIPPLDPLKIDEVQNFYVYKPYQVDAKGYVKNTVVENLHSFNVTSIRSSLMHMQSNITFQLPYFIITGTYSLRGKVMSVVPVRGHGPYLLTPSDVTLAVYTSVHIENKRLQLTNMEFDFDFTKLFVKFQGLYGGGHVGNVINIIANRFGVEIYHKVEPKVHDKIRTLLIDGINKKLQEIPLMDLIGAGTHQCQEEIRRVFGDHLE